MNTNTVIRLLLLALILFNILDTILTSIGVHVIESLTEANPLMIPLVFDFKVFLVAKLLILTTALLIFFAYFSTHTNIFTRQWHSYAALSTLILVTSFYAVVVVWNTTLITSTLLNI